MIEYCHRQILGHYQIVDCALRFESHAPSDSRDREAVQLPGVRFSFSRA